jgi:hypothetical protein
VAPLILEIVRTAKALVNVRVVLPVPVLASAQDAEALVSVLVDQSTEAPVSALVALDARVLANAQVALSTAALVNALVALSA